MAKPPIADLLAQTSGKKARSKAPAGPAHGPVKRKATPPTPEPFMAYIVRPRPEGLPPPAPGGNEVRHVMNIYLAWAASSGGQFAALVDQTKLSANAVNLLMILASGKAYRKVKHEAGVRKHEQTRKAASQSRPDARSQLADAIRAAMRPHKRSPMTFTAFMAMWAIDHLDGLRLANPGTDESAHIVTDENGDAGEQAYTWSTLEKMYSKS